MKPRPFPLEAGHPANHGFQQCSECKCWFGSGHTFSRAFEVTLVCFDVYACKRVQRERVRHESDCRGEETMYLDAYAEDLMFTARKHSRLAELGLVDQPWKEG